MYRKSQHWLNNNRPLCAREQNEHHIEVFLASPTPLSPLSWKGSAFLLSFAVSKPYGVFFKASSKISTNLGPAHWFPLIHRRKNIFEQRGRYSTSRRSSESRMRAFCSWRVIHKEMTDIQMRLPSDPAHYCAEVWRSGYDYDNQL